MSGILTALWGLARPDGATYCLQRPPRLVQRGLRRIGVGRLGRCRLDVGHPGEQHMDASGNTWQVVQVEVEHADEEDDWPWI